MLESNQGGYLLLIDLDQFKEVNDVEGHDAGDALLTEVASRLKATLPDAAIIARVGGDEFAALLDPQMGDKIETRIESLLDELRKPFVVRSSIFSCRSSIGIASAPHDGATPTSLLKSADLALYAAKRQGRNRGAFYNPDMQAAVVKRAAILQEVRKAIDAGQILPFYQPKVCLLTSRLVGFEALARWRHPERGVLTPAAFGEAFEDPDLAVAITRQMLRRVAALAMAPALD
jgi:diguanylate cyclase (GGDEF)-like protein